MRIKPQIPKISWFGHVCPCKETYSDFIALYLSKAALCYIFENVSRETLQFAYATLQSVLIEHTPRLKGEFEGPLAILYDIGK